jgi:hypothetical protein
MRKALTMAGVAVATATAFAGTALAETYILKAYAPLVVTGDHSAVSEEGIAKIAGTINGPLYIDEGGTQVESGVVSCKFTLSVDTATTDEQGAGTCRITFDDGGEVRADTTCKGVAGKGCSGEFRVTEGSGRFAGASGVGPVTFETSKRAYRVGAEGELTEIVFGIARWDDYEIDLPD